MTARPAPAAPGLCHRHLPDGRQPRRGRPVLGRAAQPRDHPARRLPSVPLARRTAALGPVRGHLRPRFRGGHRAPAPTARRPGSMRDIERAMLAPPRRRPRPFDRSAGMRAAQLVGGLYGVRLGRAFFGESMFSRATDASKVALAWLVARLKVGGFTLLDCQFMTDHLASLGAVSVPRASLCRRCCRRRSARTRGSAARFGRRCSAAPARRRPPPPEFRALDRLLDGRGRGRAPRRRPDMSSRSSWARRRRPDARRR